jgi:hypothetical protein
LPIKQNIRKHREEAHLTWKIFAFWPESRDSSLQWEFAEVLRQTLPESKA